MASIRKCPFCAEDIQAGALVCKHCRLDVAPGICVSCRKTNRPEARFCGHCGSDKVIEPPGGRPAQAAELGRKADEVRPIGKLQRPEKASGLRKPVIIACLAFAALAVYVAVPRMKLRMEPSGIKWVRIPGGTFAMGDDEFSEAKPRRQVSVKAFEMAKTEVTNKQYRSCVEAGVCTAPGSYVGGDDQPVVNVDWNQAKTFSEWVRGRLPTEAEWEFAARSAGKDWKYPWGDETATCARAVMDDGHGNGCGRGNSAWAVCLKAQGNTEQGLCDMAGNVWEWTQDWYHDSYNGAPSDGSAWESPAGSFRVLRGGSWLNDARGLHASNRYGDYPGNRSGVLGLRPARASSR